MGRILTEQAGGNHSCFRYGGEEFVLLLSDLGEEQPFELAERIRTTVESCPMPVSKRITISLGVAFHKGEPTPAKLFRKADFALYQAKETGRNRSVLAVQPNRQKACRGPAPDRLFGGWAQEPVKARQTPDSAAFVSRAACRRLFFVP
ncbi:GGDEF domain-containing protein [Saccharibacillus deserti]|uniref:GGDEF domain-containing protein n=1 Tax=Saccharibacillus deserti TaxID=1634444 RepID=UPI0034584038